VLKPSKHSRLEGFFILRSPETEAWVKEQNKTTFGYLENIPFRDDIKNRLEKLWNYEKLGAPFKEGDYTYFYKNDGLQNQYVVYRQKGDEEPEVFLNPNTFSDDGTTSLAGFGRYQIQRNFLER